MLEEKKKKGEKAEAGCVDIPKMRETILKAGEEDSPKG